MIRNILTILSVLLVLACLVFFTVFFAGNQADKTCQSVQVVVMDKAGESFIQPAEIIQLLRQYDITLKGKKLKEIDYDAVERIAMSHKLVERAECYPGSSGTVYLTVWQYMPVLRVICDEGNYYIDSKGAKTGLSSRSAADVIVATGAINDSMMVRDLYRMAMILRSNPYWDALIEQIVVEPNREWTLIPRAGDYEIAFGRPVNMETKMNRVGIFIKEYLPKMGWDRYSNISLKFENQIVCTKKES